MFVDQWILLLTQGVNEHLTQPRVTIQKVLEPKGVDVVIQAAHHCMTTRGVHKPSVAMVTSRMLGVFRTNFKTRQEFLAAIKLKRGDDASI